MKKISIVSSCYNEEHNLDELYNRVTAQMSKYSDKYEFEYILMDNGSSDGTANKLKELAQKDNRIKVIINSRNFGHIKGPYYAIINASGDAVIYIVSDLQDPPELIPDLIQQWENGNELVLLQKTRSKESKIMFLLRTLFYKVLDLITDNDVKLAENCTGSGLFDKKIIDVVRDIDDPYPYFRGLLCEIGFNRSYVQYEQPLRKDGKTSNNFYTLYDIGMLGVIKYSKKPLRFMTYLGFSMSVIMFILSVLYLVLKLIFWNTFSIGIAPIIISVLFIGAIQLFSLGILGEYVGAIYTRVDKKPLVVVKERINF